MDFYPRKVAPTSSNPYYLVTRVGGYNECIEISNGSALPNCVGYAWGRVYEYSGIRPTLSRGDADGWYNYTQDGYPRGSTPKLGAVICFDHPSSGGHVAVVEEIVDANTIYTSESDYYGYRFRYRKRTNNGNWGQDSSYTFQGFIYPHEVTPPTPEKEKNKFKWVLYANKLRNKNIV